MLQHEFPELEIVPGENRTETDITGADALVGGLTPHAVDLNITQTIENMRAYLKTGRPVFEIDPGSMY